MKKSVRGRFKLLIAPLVGLYAICIASAADALEIQPPEKWGLAMCFRLAQTPFDDKDDTVSDIYPLIFYENGDFFIEGIEAGYRLFKGRSWVFSPLARYRFFDVPKNYLDEDWRDALDVGGRFTWRVSSRFQTHLELLSDTEGNFHANLKPTFRIVGKIWDVEFYANLRWKSEDFNNQYYGLNVERPGEGFDATLGLDARFHLFKNLYLLNRFSLTVIGSETSDVSFINRSVTGTVFAGFGVFNEKTKSGAQRLRSRPYIRLAHGWATDSGLGEILTFQGVDDDHGNQLSSVFLGVPLSDEVFNLPISVYMTPGFVYHHSSDVQEPTTEYVLAVKFFYTFQWPISWRLGFAEGVSYAAEIPFVEKDKFGNEENGVSRLMNYLDVSVDVDLGRLFGADSMKDLWLGWGIHHRSGIFGQSSAFNEISGGSNYNTIYLRRHW